MARIAATLNDHVFFTLPISLQYGEEDWRKDLRRLIKLAGSENRHVVLFLQASQLLKHDFLRGDVDSLYARGEIPDLFSEEEKHQLNEVCLLLLSFFFIEFVYISAICLHFRLYINI